MKEQVISEQWHKDGHSDRTTIHTYFVIDGVLCNIKLHAAKLYTRNCSNLLYKEMTFKSTYVAKGKEKKAEGLNTTIFYWLQDVECEQT